MRSLLLRLRAAIAATLVRFVGEGVLARGISTLVGGTAASQLIGVLVLPFITRLYSPSEFAIFATFASLVAFISVIACWRLEIAISIPKRRDEAVALLIAAMCASAFTAALLAAALAAFSERLDSVFGDAAGAYIRWSVPVGVLFTGVYASLQLWATRNQDFRVVATTRIAQSLGGYSTQLAAGSVGSGVVGLIVGQLISVVIGCSGLLKAAFVNIQGESRNLSVRSLVGVAKKYGRFPALSAPESLANAGGMQLPIIAIAALAPGPEAAYVLLATRIMAVPMSFIGGSVSQVFLSLAPRAYEEGRLKEISLEAYRSLIRTGLGPICAAGLLAPSLFQVIFGTEWKEAGYLVSWMTPWFLLQFLASPVSMTVHVLGRQGMMLMLSSLGLALRLGSVVVASQVIVEWMPEAFAVASAAFYLACLIYFVRLAEIDLRDVLRLARENWHVPASWVALAMVCLIVLRLGAVWVRN